MIRPKPKPEKRIKVKRVKKKTNRSLLELEADRLVRQIVLMRDPYCVCPSPLNGHSDVMQAGHLITRGKKSVRWDLRNVNVQCSSCNLLHEHYAEIYTLWFVRKLGTQAYVDLVYQGHEAIKLSMIDMINLVKGLKHILEELEKHKENGVDYTPRFSQKEIIELGETK